MIIHNCKKLEAFSPNFNSTTFGKLSKFKILWDDLVKRLMWKIMIKATNINISKLGMIPINSFYLAEVSSEAPKAVATAIIEPPLIDP